MKIKNALLLTCSMILVTTSVWPVSSGGIQKLPKKVGTLKDAKISLCDGSKQDEIAEKYMEAVFALEGVNGFGGRSVMNEDQSPFGIRCAVLSIYHDDEDYDAIHRKVGDSLEGHLIEYIAAGPGEAQ